ncbi:Acetyl-coenzyme A synthetase [hydrothermal vent metagenome]|uniref:acetate--CoA ligase n=1 Tax=hydrothermal vent metagenome TaxID=652676 RepID=A0A1W1BW63_9ZZZZ
MKSYPVHQSFREPLIKEQQYKEMYQNSIENSDEFWAEQAEKILTWDKKWQTVENTDYKTGKISWFEGGKLNVSYNCLDRHLPAKANQTAIIFEGDNPNDSEHITYQDLYERVCLFANGLKKLGVVKGDRVCLYMPMVVEATVAMLACSRIGAIHSVVFGGFSPEALKVRILDAQCKVIITADEGIRGGKKIPLKNNVDVAISDCDCVEHIVVVEHTKGKIVWNKRDIKWTDVVKGVDKECPVEPMEANTPLFILYTSGSTGTPKGVLHSSAGYLLYCAMTHKYAFDYQDGDIYWCSADVGWITGHSYVVYGPLANGATTLIFEGVPTYPDASRFWQIIDKHQVNIFYTAPTAIRALMGAGDSFLENSNRSSLKVLGTVGEPINPEAWEWYYHKIGQGNCPIVDTWWQTETGGHMLLPLPYTTELKPGCAMNPFFGIKPEVVNEKGEVLEGEAEGVLVIPKSWPGQMVGLYNNHQRFIETYFSDYPNKYFPGDGVRRDKDGHFWITGRTDDVLNVSGHRLGTAEIESALVLSKYVSEAAVVGFPHDIKGQGIYAFVSLMQSVKENDDIKKQLVSLVRQEIGPIATIDIIQFAPQLPKTRSGKIMRRILRKIAAKDFDTLGDTSTLADESVILELINNR